MRRLIAASALLLILGATPSMARPYPWCAKTPDNGGSPQCNFATFQQCLATISGLGGDCIQNPMMGYDDGGGPRNRRTRYRDRDPGWQDDGWDNRGQDRRW